MTVIRFDVVVQFSRRRPSAAELVAVRRYAPDLRDKSLPAVRETVERACKDDWTYRFSFGSKHDAEEVVRELQARGVMARLE